jgi:hypothetical protein
VYLSRQMLDILIALKTCAGNSRYLLPSRYDADAPMSRATFNRVTYSVVDQAKLEGLPLEPFSVHDLRRTGSTLWNELGFIYFSSIAGSPDAWSTGYSKRSRSCAGVTRLKRAVTRRGVLHYGRTARDRTLGSRRCLASCMSIVWSSMEGK